MARFQPKQKQPKNAPEEGLVIKLGAGAGVGALLGAAPFYRTPI